MLYSAKDSYVSQHKRETTNSKKNQQKANILLVFCWFFYYFRRIRMQNQHTGPIYGKPKTSLEIKYGNYRTVPHTQHPCHIGSPLFPISWGKDQVEKGGTAGKGWQSHPTETQPIRCQSKENRHQTVVGLDSQPSAGPIVHIHEHSPQALWPHSRSRIYHAVHDIQACEDIWNSHRHLFFHTHWPGGIPHRSGASQGKRCHLLYWISSLPQY